MSQTITLDTFQLARFFTAGNTPPTSGSGALLEGQEAFNAADELRFFGTGGGQFLTLGASLLSPKFGLLLDGATGENERVPPVSEGYVVRGTSTLDPRPNDTLLLTGASRSDFTRQLDNRGWVIGLGCAQVGGPGGYAGTLSMLASQRFVELYPAAVTAHSTGNFSAAQFTNYQNGQSGFGQVAALQVYGMLNHKGNHGIGLFGRVDCYTGGLIDHELNTFNFFGDAPSVVGGFPNRGDQTNGTVYPNPPANPITLTLACGGTYRSTAATYVGREGSASNGPGANYRVAHFIDGRFVTDYGILIDSDGQPGGSTYNNGHGAPDTAFLARMAPTSLNGLAVQAVGKDTDWAGIVRPQLALTDATVKASDGSSSASAGNNLTVFSDGTIVGRNFGISSTGRGTFRDLSVTGSTVTGHTTSANRQLQIITPEGVFFIPLNS